MKQKLMSKPSKLVALLVGATLLGAVSQSALAAGTLQGSSVTNLAKLSYAVLGVAQNEICSAEGAGNTLGNGGTTGTTCVSGTNGATNTTFAVDAKVRSTLAADAAFVSVTPGATKQATPFTLQNTGNATVAYTLAVAEAVGGNHKVMGAAAVLDEFATTAPVAPPTDTIYIDVNNNGVLDAPDTAVVGATANVLPDGQLNLIVVRDIDVAAPNGKYAVVSLTSTAVVPAALPLAAGETALAGVAGVVIANGGANGKDTVEVVLAEPESVDNLALLGTQIDGPTNAASNGQVAVWGAYKISSSIISVQKTVSVLCDPINGATAPKYIPGATVQYAIIISNSALASASATLSTIGDALNANTTIEPSLVTAASVCATAENAVGNGFKVQSGGTSVRASTVPVFFTTANDADAVNHNLGAVAAALNTALPAEVGYAAGELKAGESVTLTFNVTVN